MIPTPPGARPRRGRRATRSRGRRSAPAELSQARRGGHGAPALHALAGRRGGDRGAGRALPARRIERAAKAAGVDPDRLEALVFLESAGRPDARAPGGIEGAAGLTQILAETATSLLAMKVDLERSAQLHAAAGHARCATGNLPRAAALNRARRRVDDRFDPAKALAGTARYLKLAQERFGREDLAFVSYHMGMGNLENVLKALRRRPALLRRAVLRLDAAAPPGRLRQARVVRRRLLQLLLEARRGDGDHAARAPRQGPAGPDRARCRPPTTPPARVLLDGAPQGDLRALPDDAADTSLTTARRTSSCAPRRSASRSTPPPRCATISGAPALRVTGAADGGWTFRISRTYASDDQALAFQYVLDRLQVLNVIAWSRSARSINVTAARDAKVLEPLLDRLGGNAK